MYCCRCGAKINDDDLFCTRCGAKVESEDTIHENEYSNEGHGWYNTSQHSYQENQWYQGQYPPAEHKNRIGCGTCFTILQAIVLIIAFIWLRTDSGKIAITDFSAYLDGGETYINMIKTNEIELLDMTYGTFINQFFYNCNWEFFKDDKGDRIVELNCLERTYDYPLCMQFKITPIGNELYYIEPCYISINGYTVNDILSLIYEFM